MICRTCQDAADAHAPRDQHCDATPGPGARCDCQHRVERYRTTTTGTTHEGTHR